MLVPAASHKLFVILLVLSAVLFIFYSNVFTFVIPKDNQESGFLLYSYNDLDQQLCKQTIDWTRTSSVEYSKLLQCSGYEEIVSIASGGRTGNLMWAYASVLSLAQQTGLKPYIPSCLKSSLEKYFENLTIPSFKDIIQCPVKFNTFVTSLEDWKVNPQSIILPRYIVFPEEIMPFIPNISKEFSLKRIFRDSAQETLRKIIENLPIKNYTFIAVHVRRTDYKDYLKRKYNLDLASPQFFLNAMEYFKQKYLDPIFIFLSDDTKWCFEQFGKLKNVFVVTDSQNKKDGAALDMAVMAACNHTIYDYGTFGEWGAILAGGEAICYDMIQNSKNGSLQFNKTWHLMS